MDRAALELLNPDRAAAEGAALGQLACELPGGGLLITASRLVEFGARATILLAPGLFRLDFTPQEETLGLYPKALGPGRPSGTPTSRPGTATATRRARRRSSSRARSRTACEAWIHVLSFTERDALATHFVAKAEIRPSGVVAERGRLTCAALTWYERVRRPLPWRATRDPYALLVSEVMLQQTQALRVVPYYERWLERFPDAGALAEAPARDVLALWSGLGYNRRALALQNAARVVVAEDGWPADLTALPGRRPVHGGRGRVVRVGRAGGGGRHQRAAGAGAARRRVRTPRELAARAASLLPPGRAATFNQAMMELGATVCRPRAPRVRRVSGRRGLPRAAARGAAAAGRRSRFEDTDRWARGRVARRAAGGRGAAGARASGASARWPVSSATA